jgi:hypothetical protein
VATSSVNARSHDEESVKRENGNSNVNSANREKLQTELFINPPSGRTATLFTTPGAASNNDKRQSAPRRLQEGSRKSNEQTAQAVNEMESLESQLFINQPQLARGIATSSATMGEDRNNRKGRSDRDRMQEGSLKGNEQSAQARIETDRGRRKPREEHLTRARQFRGDLRNLPRRKPIRRERPELEVEPNPTFYRGTPPASVAPTPEPGMDELNVAALAVQAPAPDIVFEGLDRENFGAGSPPDTTGDVGPTYYIQSVNTSVGIYRKSDGFREAAFTFDTLMSQGNFGNLCDTNNFGDPVVLYDTFEDRWILTDFAFLTDVSGNVLTPAYQCFAVSMNGNPLTGGWNFYSIQTADFLGDYPKLGIWPDGLYMSANMFTFGAGSTSQGVRTWAFNKAQMYAGSPTVKIVSFNLNSGDFTVIPSNARLQTGTPPPGRPNLFLSTWQFTNALTVYKFHVDWNSTSLSTFTGPDIPIAATAWPNAAVANAPQPGTANLLDVLQIRAMVQNQYTNFGGTESLWVPHTVRRANTTGNAAPRWYQVNVTGGNVAPAIPQAATWDPDGANLFHRFMPSLALDRAGNMAMGYTTSNTTNPTGFPSMKYAGRLSTDAINTFSQTEQTLFSGTASQTTSTRWGDYSSMMLDPDGCTFWYTNEYANPADQTAAKRWLTKIGSFKFSACTPVGAGGTVTGTVTDSVTTNPINGATVALGSRTTTTDISGVYTFSAIPAGTYPSITASFAGYGPSTATNIVVADAATTTQDFSLTPEPNPACLTDTTRADFLLGVFTGVDLDTSPGDVTLKNFAVDQQNTAGTTTGTGFGTPAWTGQTFIPAVTGQLEAADIQVFCNGCGATPPNLTLSVRNTAAGLPTGADLASVTIPGSNFASGATVTFTATFGAPATLTSGTQYALILRPVSVPAGSGYFWIRSSPSTYANGSRVLSADSGGTWSADTTRDYNFKAYIRGPYSPASGNLISSPKDSNPAVGLTPIWSTLSWNATTPANTSVQFQVAGSNSVNAAPNFVGPDGTAGTFFTTSPASLSQFYGLRYLRYKAFLATTNNAVAPTLHDVNLCFANVDCSTTVATITPTPAQVCENSTGNAASGPAGMTTYAWGITNGTITSATNTQSITYTAGASGTVTLSLTVTAPNGCIASSSALITINPIPATPTITPGGPTTFCAGGSVTLSSSSATGNQWYLNGNPIGGETNQTYIATGAGSYTTVVTTSGCSSAPSAATIVTVNPTPATPTITPDGPTTFCASGSVSLTSSSGTGNQWFLNGNPIGGATNQIYSATASGDYTVVVTDGNSCVSAPSSATTVTVNPTPATPTITPGGPTTFCTGGSVSLSSSSATGNQWFLNGNPIGGATNQTYSASAAGGYTVVVTDGNSCVSVPSSATTVTVNPTPATPTITPGGPTTFCTGGSVSLSSSNPTGNQWYLNGNPIGGATNQVYSATASGAYTVVVTGGNSCVSAPSAATTVTVNPVPAAPIITPTGSTTFCAGGGVTLTSSSTSGNQWYLNGNPIGGATSQSYFATSAGNYTDVVTSSGCSSAPSAATVVTANTAPTLTYASPQAVPGGGSLNVTPTAASDNGTVTYQVLAGHGLTTAPTVNPSGVVSITNAESLGAHTITVRATDDCGSITDTMFTLQVQSPANVSGTKTVSGPFPAGGSITYVIVLSNSSTSAQFDNPGNEFTDVLPPSLTLVSANATSGAATPNLGTNSVTWNGSIAGSSAITITITATINNVADGTGVSNQGTINYDSDGNGTNESSRMTDDPSVVGPSNPTNFTVVVLNDPPDAVDDALSIIAEDSGTRTIPIATLLANDNAGPSNESGQTITLTAVSNSVAGTVSRDATNVYFTSAADYTGPTSFQYTITDNGTTGGSPDPKSDTATVSFTITAVNDAPTAVNDGLPNIPEDSGPRLILGSTLAANDIKGPADENGQTLIVKTVSNPEGGTVAIAAGDVVFTPTANYSGPASFIYTVEDNGTTNGLPDPKVSGPAVVQFNITAVADTPSVTNAITNANTQTISGLVITRNPDDGGFITHFKITEITGGTLYKRDGTTVIPSGGFITVAEGNAGLKFTASGATNGSFVVQSSTSSSDAGLGGGTATATIFVNPLGGSLQFSAANYSVPESAGFTTITVQRTGDLESAVTVEYATSDHSHPADSVPCTSPGAGLASSRCDFTTAIGTLRFASGETSKTFVVLINQDNYGEGPETLGLMLSGPTGGAALGSPSTAVLQITDDVTEPGTNPIDNSADFVRAQYHDILGREPDAAGLAFWTDNIEKCNDPLRIPAGQTVAQCIDKQRESTAIAFFMSPEFQITGGFVHHLYKGSLTGAPNYDGGSAGRFPTFLEFMHDMSQVSEGIVVNGQISGAVVEANRNALAAAFVARPEFVAKYGGLSNTLYVQELFNTTGIGAMAAEKQALVDGLTGGTETRASVLRKVVDGTVVIDESNVQFITTYGQAFINQENRRLFVFLEYAGYLRRNPDTPGFVFWLGKLNFFNGDPVQAEMVRSFILSPEYRNRFGQP